MRNWKHPDAELFSDTALWIVLKMLPPGGVAYPSNGTAFDSMMYSALLDAESGGASDYRKDLDSQVRELIAYIGKNGFSILSR